MKLERLAKQQTVMPMKLPVTLMEAEMSATLPSDGLLLDWRSVLPFLVDEKTLPQTRAFAFHAWLADFMLMVAQKARHVFGIEEVAFSGGVFQNTLLLRLAKARLGADHFRVVMPGTIPVNDAGLAIGQLLEVCHG
jgi:hydrogenase maturation protein HypF